MLADLASCSMNCVMIPQALRTAFVMPVWKGVDKETSASYRPISLTSHIGKILERLDRKQVQDYLTINNLIEDE